MSRVHMICPHRGCHRLVSASDELRGQLVTCHACRRIMRVPQLRKLGTSWAATHALLAARIPPGRAAA